MVTILKNGYSLPSSSHICQLLPFFILHEEMVNRRRNFNKVMSIYHINKSIEVSGVLRSDYVGKNIRPKLSGEQDEQSTEL